MSKEFMRRYTLDREPKDITIKDLEQPYESTFDFQMKMAFETMVESFAKKSDKEIIDFLYKKYMNTDVKDVFLLSEKDFKQFLLEMLPKWREEKHYLKWEDLVFQNYAQEISVLLNGNKYLLGYLMFGDEDMVWVYKENKQICSLDGKCPEDKKFFNDLHLERVEE